MLLHNAVPPDNRTRRTDARSTQEKVQYLLCCVVPHLLLSFQTHSDLTSFRARSAQPCNRAAREPGTVIRGILINTTK